MKSKRSDRLRGHHVKSKLRSGARRHDRKLPKLAHHLHNYFPRSQADWASNTEQHPYTSCHTYNSDGDTRPALFMAPKGTPGSNPLKLFSQSINPQELFLGMSQFDKGEMGSSTAPSATPTPFLEYATRHHHPDAFYKCTRAVYHCTSCEHPSRGKGDWSCNDDKQAFANSSQDPGAFNGVPSVEILGLLVPIISDFLISVLVSEVPHDLGYPPRLCFYSLLVPCCL
ncbi:hypothetical protein BD779DRAFT_1554640 [Infundibulicybe gibba]|nr:hypothetical protein BD779DRAFT_1554640 [Infundibulicybe gibba]